MRNLVECLATILIFWSSDASNKSSINEFSEVMSKIKSRVFNGVSEFFPSNFLSIPQVVQDSISSLITQRCFPCSVICERPHAAAKQLLIHVVL